MQLVAVETYRIRQQVEISLAESGSRVQQPCPQRARILLDLDRREFVERIQAAADRASVARFVGIRGSLRIPGHALSIHYKFLYTCTS